VRYSVLICIHSGDVRGPIHTFTSNTAQ
jgi:hypothetical protein